MTTTVDTRPALADREEPRSARTKRPGELKLGIHLNTPSHVPGRIDWTRTFEEYLRLAEFAESLGIDSLWSRQRHFQEQYLSSPLTFFAAASQRTSRLSFGTALLVLRYWDPILLAEELSTVDLLLNGRLDVVYSNSRAFRAEFQDEIFRLNPDQVSDRIEHSVDRLRAALAGEAVYTLDEPTLQYPEGSELFVQPRSESLVERLWYGSGSVESAREAATKDLHLFVSTVGRGDVEATQIEQVRIYKETLGSAAAADARVGVGRYILPVTKAGQVDRYERWQDWFLHDRSGHGRMGSAPIYLGEPDRIADGLASSDVVSQAETLLVYLPYDFTFDEYRDQLEALATDVAPQLGWTPAL